jgi:hypothetical protein
VHIRVKEYFIRNVSQLIAGVFARTPPIVARWGHSVRGGAPRAFDRANPGLFLTDAWRLVTGLYSGLTADAENCSLLGAFDFAF